MSEYAVCAKCHLVVTVDGATSVTVTIAPPVVVYYHPECHDPWRDEVGHGATEVRTTSHTGGEKGVKPARFDLIPVGPLTTVAKLYGQGAKKYEDHNWRRGYEWSKSYAALMRHVTQFWEGEDEDRETGLPHLASVAWHALVLMEFAATHPEYDDRYSQEEGRP